MVRKNFGKSEKKLRSTVRKNFGRVRKNFGKKITLLSLFSCRSEVFSHCCGGYQTAAAASVAACDRLCCWRLSETPAFLPVFAAAGLRPSPRSIPPAELKPLKAPFPPVLKAIRLSARFQPSAAPLIVSAGGGEYARPRPLRCWRLSDRCRCCSSSILPAVLIVSAAACGLCWRLSDRQTLEAEERATTF